MVHLLYISAARAYISPKVIEDILESSVRNNTKAGVSGLLVARGGRFVQLLEGEREDVVRTFKRIEQDNRHGELRMVLEFESEDRIFPQWAMGHVPNAPVEAEFVDQVDVLARASPENIAQAKQAVIALLRKFNS